jgi:Chaperonin 10 Kd subunit
VVADVVSANLDHHALRVLHRLLGSRRWDARSSAERGYPLSAWRSPTLLAMKFRPLHDRVVVRRIEEDTKTKGGIIIPDIAKENRSPWESSGLPPPFHRTRTVAWAASEARLGKDGTGWTQLWWWESMSRRIGRLVLFSFCRLLLSCERRPARSRRCWVSQADATADR